MKLRIVYRYALLFSLGFSSCSAQTNKIVADANNKKIEPSPWPVSDSLNYISLADSAKLIHIKNQFYRNRAGKLFEKMDAPKNPIDIDAGVVTFFKATNPDIDPLTFEIIDGSWFAHDKNFVYNYRENDSGMFCITMRNANVKYFKLLPDDSGIYGADNNHVFQETEVIENIDPKKMHIILDKDKHLVKITSGLYVFMDSWGTTTAKLIKTAPKRNSK